MNHINVPFYRKIILYLIIIAVLIDSTTMYKYLTNSPLFGGGFGWPLGFLCILYAVQASKLRITNAIKLKLPILILFLLIYVIANNYNAERYLISYVGMFFFLFIFAYVLYQKGEMRAFLRAFSNVMVAIAIISIFFWLFGSILDILPGRTQLSYYWADRYRTTYSYYYLYFENPSQNITHGSICNLGIFTESPGYSGFLTYALLIEIVLGKNITEKKQKRKAILRTIILIVTLFTTNSTKGIIVVLIALAIEYVAKEEKSRIKKVIKVLGSLIAIVVVAYASFTLINGKLETSSGLVRFDDLRSGFQTFLDNPVFGAGYNNVDAIIDHQLVTRGNRGLSMGLTTILAYGGLWLFSIYLGAVVASFRSAYFSLNRKQWILVVIVLLYNLIISNSGFSSPYLFAIAAAYAAPRATNLRSGNQNGAKLKKELLI